MDQEGTASLWNVFQRRHSAGEAQHPGWVFEPVLQLEGAALIMALFGKSVPVILKARRECGIACLAMIASYHGHLTDLSAMRLRLSPSLKGVTPNACFAVAESMGLAARNAKRRWKGCISCSCLPYCIGT